MSAGVEALHRRVELEALDAVLLDQPPRLARAHLALVRIDRAEGDHDVAVLLRGLGDLLVRDAPPPHLRLGVDGEVDEADLLLAVEGDRLVHRRPLARAEVLVGGAVVLLAVVVERVAARHLEVGVGVDGDQVGVVHGGSWVRRRAGGRRARGDRRAPCRRARRRAGRRGRARGRGGIRPARAARRDVEQRHRHAARRAPPRAAASTSTPAIEAQQRVVGAERVVERAAVGEPEVRRAAARHRRRREAAHRVRRRRLVVVGDQRRAVVEVAEVQAGAAELLHVELVGCFADLLGADRVALGAGLLDPRRHGAARLDHLLRVVHREARDLLGDRLALGLVGVEDRLVAPSRARCAASMPGQVQRIGDAGVHAVAGIGHPEVRGIAADEDAAGRGSGRRPGGGRSSPPC